ncbi:MAG TPA: type II toxin-antitoxin system CcdA family antitoxin [Actinophytocola sp.]|nr:type II toxin-antitoxin system CcdA family antitoxin [Actinophytocola sp.]
MRMARVNITVPDELLSQARAAGLNVSRLAASAVAEELDRLAKIAALDTYLAELDAELGPMSDQEEAAAREWADQLSSGSGRNTSTRSGAA